MKWPFAGALQRFRELSVWRERAFSAPSPDFVKRACLLRNGIPGATWVETGTSLGITTRLLAAQAGKVYTLEPEPTLFANARRTLADLANVEVLNGTSEQLLPRLLETLRGDVNFWLDGHYSGGVTFKGEKDTPVVEELAALQRALPRLGRVAVLVDDIRYFSPATKIYSGYPSLDFLVDWARANGFSWHIEHDMFVARNF